MSEKIIRASSGEANERDRTDWVRLRAMTDDELDVAIAADPDAALGPDGEMGPLVGVVFRDSHGEWRWRLLNSDRTPIADSPRSYSSRDEVDASIRALRTAMTADRAKAA